ncbi:anti-sigma F factor [Clostridioides difficile]|uniref:ATP-binding protein n=1 Tax=Clostridioides difficile TaxID=1496 RepID=UPI002E8E1A6F|nr:anti-sigma F factor [Clostridioides difficile]
MIGVEETGEIERNTIKIILEGEGYGIENVEKAKEPLYTSKPELDRSGMGFTVMKSFMDDGEVSSVKDNGTRIEMTKKINVPK